MKFQLFDRVSLKVDVPDMRLKANDIVTVVEFLKARHDLPNAYCVEAFNAIGETIAVFTIAEDDIEALTANDVLSHRTLEAA